MSQPRLARRRTTTDEEMPTLGHVAALDGLRGLAVLIVVYHHAVGLLPGPNGSPQFEPITGGFLGVDIFFVLSGFLITAILLDETRRSGRVGLRSFYMRRGFRLLPALYCLLGVHLLYVWLTGLPIGPEVDSVRDGVLYVYNWRWRWATEQAQPNLVHLWSLAVEEQFYLLWPLAVILLTSLVKRASWRAGVIGATVLAVTVHRWVLFEGTESPFTIVTLYARTDTRADSLLVGALLAQLWAGRFLPRRGLVPAAWLSTIVVAVAIVRVEVLDSVLYRGGYTVVAIAVAVIIAATLQGGWLAAKLLTVAPLRLVGRVSYGLYLWHGWVFVVVLRYGGGWGWATRLAVGLLAAAVLTSLSWHLVERPMTRLRHRLQPSSPPRQQPAAQGTDPSPVPLVPLVSGIETATVAPAPTAGTILPWNGQDPIQVARAAAVRPASGSAERPTDAEGATDHDQPEPPVAEVPT